MDCLDCPHYELISLAGDGKQQFTVTALKMIWRHFHKGNQEVHFQVVEAAEPTLRIIDTGMRMDLN